MDAVLETTGRAFLGLRTRFRGALIQPGDEAYADSRRIWNGAVDRRPALIARCVDADDVLAALRFARDQGLPISVRGSGYGVAGIAVSDDTIMIDLSLLKGVSVDPAARLARAAAGATWGEFDLATQRYGLATTGGAVSHAGISGLTLHGGFGHLLRRHGLTVDNLRAVDLITADGQQLQVDAETEPELFWGLRGGGGNSASRQRSATICTLSGRSYSAGRCIGRWSRHQKSCGLCGTSHPRHLMILESCWSPTGRRHCRSCHRSDTAHPPSVCC